MAKYKTAKDLLGGRSDHTQVDEHRLSYLVNMYRDYGSGQGVALETVPGFRIRALLPGEEKVYGIHVLRVWEATGFRQEALVHAGNRLYRWLNFPNDVGTEHETQCLLPESGIILSEQALVTFY